MTVFLRNRHPKRALAIPCNGHWCRLVPAGATSMLPEAVLGHPVTRLLLAKQLIMVVDAAQYDADARQEQAGRIDIAELARRAEQAEFDRLLAGMRLRYRPETRRPRQAVRPRKPRADEWPPAQLALLRRRAGEGISGEAIAAEVGRTPGATVFMARRMGLRLPRKPPANQWPAEWTETLKRRWAAGATGKAIAEELGVKPTVVFAHVTREGLEKRYDHRNGGRKASAVRNTLGAL